jgi:starch phosphorylase
VSGVDVWINTPEYPLEASGTSGQKAGINGIVNLSVLDGWWGEGYNGENGWGITPHGQQYDSAFRDREEAQTLLDILEYEVVPLYYKRNGHGYSEGWVERSKASMKSVMPHFNAQRMVMDYVRKFYGTSIRHRRMLLEDDARPAQELAQWKTRVFSAWSGVGLRRVDHTRTEIMAGESLVVQVAAQLNGLQPDDVVLECLVGTADSTSDFSFDNRYFFEPVRELENGEFLFELNLSPELAGLQYYKVRMYPWHQLLSHPFEMGFMIWL